MARYFLSRTAKLLIFGGFLTSLLTLYTLHPSSSRLRDSVSGIFWIKQQPQCPPDLWASGQWAHRNPPRTDIQNVTSVADVLALEGFQGCASDREYKWHITADEDQWDRFPDVASYEWTPPTNCNVRHFERQQVIRDMVEKGGWLLLGGECPSAFRVVVCPPAGPGNGLFALTPRAPRCHSRATYPSIISLGSFLSIFRYISSEWYIVSLAYDPSFHPPFGVHRSRD